MTCPHCGGFHFTIHFIELDQRISGRLNERAVFCINVLTNPALNEPYEPMLHTRITCQDCGDSFVKKPYEWLREALNRHCQDMKQSNTPAR